MCCGSSEIESSLTRRHLTFEFLCKGQKLLGAFEIDAGISQSLAHLQQNELS